MSMTWEEAIYEEAMEALYVEHKQQAIEEFTAEKLQSYYIAHPHVAEAPSRSLAQSRELLSKDPTAAFIFAAIAIEVGLKVALLKPVVYGLVHSESVAGIITDMVIVHTGYDRFRQLLLHILSNYGGIDLTQFKRSKSSKLLWEEMKEVQKQRNQIIHSAKTAIAEESEKAVAVASAILEELFPSVVKNLGFHVYENGYVCSDWRCTHKELIKKFKLETWLKTNSQE